MAQQTFSIGTVANDDTGDPLRDILGKCAANFTDLYSGKLNASVVSVDGTMASDSDALVPSQKAVVTYVASLLAGLAENKGAIDCGANPDYPVASNGDFYRVSVAGKVGGGSGTVVAVGDVVLAVANNAGGTQASVGSSWIVLEANITGITVDGLNMLRAASAAAQRSLLSIENTNNTSDADKPVSTAQQAGLDAKEATQTAASQAEAEAGTGTSIRSWTPQRIAQAIAALAAGGGGAALVRGSGLLRGYTDPGAPATSPPDLTWSYSSSLETEYTFTITINGAAHNFTVSATDPANGTTWVDSTSFGVPPDMATAMAAAINALSLSGISVTPSGSDFTLVNMGTGASASSAGSVSLASGFSGGGTGSAETSSGEISEVVLIPLDGTKRIKPVRAGVFGDGSINVQLALKASGSYYPIDDDLAAATLAEAVVRASYIGEWINGRTSAALVALITGGVPTGGTATAWAIAEQA